MVVAYSFVGPLSFLPIKPTPSLIIGAVACFAFGQATVSLTTMTRAQKATITAGYESDIETYYLISSKNVTFPRGNQPSDVK